MTDYNDVTNYIQRIMPVIEKPALSRMPFPSLSISYGQYYPSLFCWDNHHMAMRFGYAGKPEYMKFLIATLLYYQTADGYTPNCVSATEGPGQFSPRFHAQPFLMQCALMYLCQTGDTDEVKTQFDKLALYLSFYEKFYTAPNGLFRWPVDWMSGIDNDIATSIFSPETIIPADLSSWMVLEYRSAAQIAKKLGKLEQQKCFIEKACNLSQLINKILWNEEMGSYSAYNLCSGRHQFRYEDPYLNPAIGRYAFQTCSNLIPLYARIADQDKASVMIEKYVLSEQHFASPFGIRSLSKSSEYYNNAVWGNPPRFGDHRRLTNSNWQGPVWIPLNYFMYHALDYYGFTDGAKDLADKTVKLLAMSLKSIGSFAENYHADTGVALYAREFASWNILADMMHKEGTEVEWCMKAVFENTLL